MSASNSTALPDPATEFLGHVAYHLYKMEPLLPTYLHLLVSASFPIITAAHASLRRPPSAAPAKKSKSGDSRYADDSEDEEKSQSVESLNVSDAVLFPILAGVTLTALYMIIKWLEDPAILNKVLGYYFSWIGIFFCAQYLQNIFIFSRSWLFPSQYSSGGLLYKIDSANRYFEATKEDGTVVKKTSSLPSLLSRVYLPEFLSSTLWKIRQTVYFDVTCIVSCRKPLSPSKATFRITILDLLAAAIAGGIALYQNLLAKDGIPWYLTNLIGTSFCYTSLQIISPGTAGIGSLLLSLLFFYDIYMVFFTPMMVTVATKLDVPIKLLFPRPHEVLPEPVGALPGSQEMQEYLESLAKKRTMAMLGLGDIVVPGILIAFALRFDLYRYYLKIKAKSQEQHNHLETVEGQNTNDADRRPTYSPARGSWAERFYTARKDWSALLEAKAFPKPYFNATMVGYVGGMIATLIVMQVFNHAQPALLYLVPGVLIGMWGMALWKGELGLLWSFDENEEEKAKEKKEQEANDEKKETEKQDQESNSTEKTQPESSKLNANKDKTEGAKATSDSIVPKDESKSELQSFFSIHFCIRNAISQTSSQEKAESKPGKLSSPIASDNNSEPDLEQLSESSISSKTSSSSTPQIIFKEEVDQLDEIVEESKPEVSRAVPVPTKTDEDGGQAVKRRRRG